MLSRNIPEVLRERLRRHSENSASPGKEWASVSDALLIIQTHGNAVSLLAIACGVKCLCHSTRWLSKDIGAKGAPACGARHAVSLGTSGLGGRSFLHVKEVVTAGL